MTWTTLGYAFIGGLLPSLIWLYFLLKEDSRCPEPKTMIGLAFVVGMVAVPLVLPLEQFSCSVFAADPIRGCAAGSMSWQTFGFAAVFSWAAIEELMKYAMAAIFILWRPVVNEATDYVIYMITVALGFAAAENMLFLLSPLFDGHVAASIVTGDFRFIGANLLHIVASATVGLAIAFAKLSRMHIRLAATVGGLILAIALHTAFNTLMIIPGTSSAFSAVFLVWIIAVIFLAAFEVLKYFQYRNLPPNSCPT